jgi:hypothetical protein
LFVSIDGFAITMEGYPQSIPSPEELQRYIAQVKSWANGAWDRARGLQEEMADVSTTVSAVALQREYKAIMGLLMKCLEESRVYVSMLRSLSR